MSQLLLKPITLQRFLVMSADDLRVILAEFPTRREKRKSPLDGDAIESLIRVMHRTEHTTVSDLGTDAARAWAARIGIG
jgi:hypothetical protein